MARVLFLQEVAYDVLGVMYLSGYAKRKGHEVDILIESEERKEFFPKIIEFNPDAVAFSVTVGYQRHYLNIAQKVKDMLGVPVIFGGPHCTVTPELIENPPVDVLCRGEGEEAFVDFLDALDTGGDIAKIPNLWSKKDGSIIRNDVRPGEENLDRYSPPDRSLYYKYDNLRNRPLKTFFASRGCPYNCSFCFNQVLVDLYKGKMKIVRRVSPQQMVEEILDCREKYPLERFYFDDDLFISDKGWLEEFAPLFNRKVGLPFACNVHANLVNEEVVKLLKEAGCYLVMWGIESGDQEIRYRILNKRISDDKIHSAAELFRKYDIKMKAFNLMGIPGETFEQALKTIKLNADIKIDYPWCNIALPLPGTKLEKIAWEMEVLPDNFNANMLNKSTAFFDENLIQPDFKRVARLQKLFYIGVKHPWTIPIIAWLSKLPLNFIYKIVFGCTFSYRFMRETRLPFSYIVRIIKRHIKLA